MNKLVIAISTVAVIGFGSTSFAGDDHVMKDGMPAPGKAGAMGKSMEHNADTMDHSTGTMHQGMQMEGMDTNNDGMVSREEYTKHHGMKYDKMKKNAQGGVDMKEFGMMEGGQDRSTMSDSAAN